MFFNFFQKRISYVNALFQGHYIDAKVLYTFYFNEVPAVSFIGDLDGSKAFKFINDRYQFKVTGIYQHNYFDHEKKEVFFNNTLFVFKDKRIIEIAGNYCHVLHTKKQYNWALEIVKELSKFHAVMASANENKVIGFARDNSKN